MKRKILLSIALIVALLGTVAFATEYATDFVVSESDKAAGVMPHNDELTPTDDANTLKNTTVVGDDDPTPYSIPEEWRRDVTEDMWRENEADKTIVTRDDFQAGENVKISNVSIDGNAFYAGETVTISNADIYGDVFVFAQYFDIENAYISGSVYALGQEIDIDNSNIIGNVYVLGEAVLLKTANIQDLFGLASTMSIDNGSAIYRSANMSADTVSINNTQIGRNVNVTANNIECGSATYITGDLNYYSENEASVAEGANIGNINRSEIVKDEEAETKEESKVVTVLHSVAVSLLKAVLVCGFIFLFAKGFIEKQKVNNSVQHILVNTAKGLLWAIVIPVVVILLFATGFAFGVSFVVLALYFVIFMVSMPVVAVSIGAAFTKDNKNVWGNYGITLIAAIAIILLEQIPTVGGIIRVIVGLSGMGLIFSSLKNKKLSKNEAEVVSEEA